MDSEAISIRGDIQQMGKEIDKLNNRVDLLEEGKAKIEKRGDIRRSKHFVYNPEAKREGALKRAREAKL